MIYDDDVTDDSDFRILEFTDPDGGHYYRAQVVAVTPRGVSSIGPGWVNVGEPKLWLDEARKVVRQARLNRRAMGSRTQPVLVEEYRKGEDVPPLH